jgi:hypothetical protein
METERDTPCQISLVEIEVVVRDLQALYLRLRDVLDSFVSLRSRLSQTKYMLPDIAEIEAEEIKYSKKKERSRLLKGGLRRKNKAWIIFWIKNTTELLDFWKREITEYLQYLENLNINDPQHIEELKVSYLLSVVLLTELIERLAKIMRELE